MFSHSAMSDSATPWAVAHQAPLSMGFPRQGYCSGLPFPTPGDLPDPGIEPESPPLQVDSSPLRQQGSPRTVLSAVLKLGPFFPHRHQQGIFTDVWGRFPLSQLGDGVRWGVLLASSE